MNKILNILKILILVSLIILFLTASSTKKNHCDTCEFELEGKKIGASYFVNDYFAECINPYVKRNNLENFSGLVIE